MTDSLCNIEAGNLPGVLNYQCCCICRNHLQVFSHPWVDGEYCTEPTGQYVCSLFAHYPDDTTDDRRATLSTEHSGGCECFSVINDKKEWYEKKLNFMRYKRLLQKQQKYMQAGDMHEDAVIRAKLKDLYSLLGREYIQNEIAKEANKVENNDGY